MTLTYLKTDYEDTQISSQKSLDSFRQEQHVGTSNHDSSFHAGVLP